MENCKKLKIFVKQMLGLAMIFCVAFLLVVKASPQLGLFITRQKGGSFCQNATFGSKGTAMKKLTHSESEIVKSVNELEAWVFADEICRRLNVSRATLKKMYANLALDNEILREVIEKKL